MLFLCRWFERISAYCQQFNNLIPVAFVLGFYVSIVVSRFWEQFRTIPYPNRMAMFVTTLVTGNDERGRLMRRTIMRYLNLTFVMTMSSISPPVKKRFPQLDHMREAGKFESFRISYRHAFCIDKRQVDYMCCALTSAEICRRMSVRFVHVLTV
jgi:hypothetical protein